MVAVMMDEIVDQPEKDRDGHVALEAWSRWALSGLAGLGLSPINIIGKIIELGIRGAAQSSGARPVEIDEMCESVDRAILRLDKTEKEVIYRTYLRNDAAQVTARKCGLTYGYYRLVLSRARQRVGDYLAGTKKDYC